MAYLKFLADLKANNVELTWHYYNDGKAWLAKGLFKWLSPRGKEKELTVFWLSIWEGLFKVSIFIPKKERENTFNLSLSNETKEMINKAQQMGKLKFFPLVFEISEKSQLADIYSLIEFKKELK